MCAPEKFLGSQLEGRRDLDDRQGRRHLFAPFNAAVVIAAQPRVVGQILLAEAAGGPFGAHRVAQEALDFGGAIPHRGSLASGDGTGYHLKSVFLLTLFRWYYDCRW